MTDAPKASVVPDAHSWFELALEMHQEIIVVDEICHSSQTGALTSCFAEDVAKAIAKNATDMSTWIVAKPFRGLLKASISSLLILAKLVNGTSYARTDLVNILNVSDTAQLAVMLRVLRIKTSLSIIDALSDLRVLPLLSSLCFELWRFGSFLVALTIRQLPLGQLIVRLPPGLCFISLLCILFGFLLLRGSIVSIVLLLFELWRTLSLLAFLHASSAPRILTLFARRLDDSEIEDFVWIAAALLSSHGIG